MAILINDTTPRSQYTATSGQTVFTVPFEFFENSDLKVYKNSTLLTLTTDYTVTGAGVTSGGSITLVSGATAGDILTIVRDVPVKRVTDFPTSGPFNVDALNSDLDRLTAMVQQQEALDGRSLRLDQFDTPNTLNTLPAKVDRIGRVLAFNATTGQPEAGPTIAATQTVANASADIDTVAGSIANVNTVAGNITNINTVAGVSSAVSTVATDIAAVNTVAADLNEAVSEIETVAGSISNVNTVGANISNVNTVAGISANVTTVAGISSNVSTVAGNSANVTTVAGSIAAVNTNATNIVAIQNASSNASTATTKAAEASSSASAAAAAQTAAESARDATLASFDSFDDRYLGSKTGDPATDNDGNTLLAGALYFNSSSGIMKVYTGSAWVAAYVSGADFLPLSGGALSGSVTQTVNSSADAFRITQTGAGNALVVEDSTNPDSTPFVVDASGRVIIGGTAAQAGGINLSMFNSAASTAPVYEDFYKDRAGAVVTSGDGIGRIRFLGYDGANYINAAQIDCLVDGTPGTNDMPGRLVFYTTADGASSPSERMRINNAGNVGIGITSSVDTTLYVGKNITGATTAYGLLNNGPIQSDVTATAYIFRSRPQTAAASFTLTNLNHYAASQNTIGAGSAVTNQYGFNADSSLTGATNNYGFYGNIASGTGRWNFYAAGTADNYFAGNVGIGVAPSGSYKLEVATGALSVTSSGATGTLVLSDTASSNGCNIKITGNGGTTPSKYLRVTSGSFGIVNSGYTAAILALTDSGDLSVTGSVSDSIGNVRTVPINSQTAGYTLVAADSGKHVSITTGGVTVPAGVFSAGQMITIYNNSASNQTITQGASVTMYIAGTATTGNRTLAQRGLVTLFCVASNTFVINGGGLS